MYSLVEQRTPSLDKVRFVYQNQSTRNHWLKVMHGLNSPAVNPRGALLLSRVEPPITMTRLFGVWRVIEVEWEPRMCHETLMVPLKYPLICK